MGRLRLQGMLVVLLLLWNYGVYAVPKDVKIQANGGTSQSNPNKLQKLEFLIDWQAEPTYLGIYYAKHIGAFTRLGWDVEVVQSWGANQAVATISAGRYRIGTASGGATVLAYNNDAKIVSLAVLYPKIPSVVYGLARTAVRTPQDLEGKRIGIYPGSITNNEFDAFVKINHLNRDRMKIVSLSGPDIPLLLSGQVDAVLHYTEMSPVVVELNKDVPDVNGKRTFELRLSESGVGGYGLNIVTSRQTYANDPVGMKNLAKAAVRGYRQGCRDPKRAVQAFLQFFPDKDPIYVESSWSRVCELVGKNPGLQTDAGWQETIDLYKSLKLLKVPVNVKDIMP